MKTASNEQNCTTTNTQAKTGFMSPQKIRTVFHLNHTSQLVANHLSPLVIEFAAHEKEIKAYEIEAELRKASARTYANPSLIR